SLMAEARLGERARKAALVLAEGDARTAYVQLLSPADPGRAPDPSRLPEPPAFGFVEQMMWWDTVGYLPDDVLTKVDRASMASSLEVRAPYLDPDVFAAAWSLPLAAKLGGGQGKLPLRRLLRRYLPDDLVDRPKSGFGAPIGAWLRGPLRPWAEDLLAPAALARADGLDAPRIRAWWDEHQAGRVDREHQLWAVLMHQSWSAARAERLAAAVPPAPGPGSTGR
ncbi:MAG: asnB, partial [Actinomycetia bacterium]|nr:asnB [Actinomycetes bacterium]